MNYDAYRYLWPPRPETKVPPAMMGYYQRRGWWGQLKKNGTCTLIFARGDEVTFRTRHDEEHKLWTPGEAHRQFFRGRSGWNVYVAELLHSKVPGIRDHLYVFDVLVSDGYMLAGSTFAGRQELLGGRFPHKAFQCPAGWGSMPIGAHCSIAMNYETGFDALWGSMGPQDEGIVFKNPTGILDDCLTPASNSGWQVKMRRPHANYSF